MITYLIIGILLVLLAISLPIIAFILYRKYNFSQSEIEILIIINLLMITLFLVFGFNCIIRSTLLF